MHIFNMQLNPEVFDVQPEKKVKVLEITVKMSKTEFHELYIERQNRVRRQRFVIYRHI